MKVAVIAPPVFAINEDIAYGFERVLISFCQEVSKHCQVTLIAPVGSRVPGVEVLETIEPTRDWGSEEAHYEAYAGHLGEFDIIHSNDHSGLVFRYLAQNPDARIVHTCHGLQTWEAMPIGPNVAYVVLSRFHLRDMEARYGKEYRYEIIPNGIPLADFPYEPDKDDYFLHLGLVAPHKGAFVAISAARKAGVKLILAGEDKFVADSVYVELVKAMATGNVEYLGCVSHEQKLRLVQKATALILPFQIGEADSLIVKEAMACGTPVLATPLGAIPELITPGVNGFMCATTEEFISTIENDAEIDPEACRRKALGFAVGDTADKYVALYRSLMPKKVLDYDGTGLYETNYYDEIHIGDVLTTYYQVSKVTTVLGDAHTLLRPGGRLVVEVPDLKALVNAIAEKRMLDWPDVHAIFHAPGGAHRVTGFSPESLCRLVTAAGYSRVSYMARAGNIVITGEK
ncbi:MAG: glycosyltransferase [Dehalococcoidia bacterium]|nr:glycosyltransferase [Dehalococcoidia bacterium]